MLSSVLSDELCSCTSEQPNESGGCRADEYNIYILSCTLYWWVTRKRQIALKRRWQNVTKWNINNWAASKTRLWVYGTVRVSRLRTTTVIITRSLLQNKMSASSLCNLQQLAPTSAVPLLFQTELNETRIANKERELAGDLHLSTHRHNGCKYFLHQWGNKYNRFSN